MASLALVDLVVSGCGELAGILGGGGVNAAAKAIGIGLADSFPALIRPANHDFYLGLRTAQIKALSCVFADWKKHHEQGDDDPYFKLRMESWLSGENWLRNMRSAESRLRGLDEDQLERLATLKHAFLGRSDAPQPQVPAVEPAEIQAAVSDLLKQIGEVVDGGRPNSVVVPDAFQKLMHSTEKGSWYGYFRLFLAEEIKTNERYRSIIEAAERHAMQNQMAEVVAQIKALSATRVDALEGLGEALAPVTSAIESAEQNLLSAFAQMGEHKLALIARPRLPKPESLVYRFAVDEFRGRDTEIEKLLAFLDPRADPRRFNYAILHGPAGAGKSRLALELADRVRDQWPVADFVRVANLRDPAALDALREWQPTVPTFLVIDYASSLPKLPDVLEALASASNKSHVPLRVLLMDRFVGEWSEALNVETGSRPLLTGARFGEPIGLGPLPSEELIAIVRQRLGADGDKRSDEELKKRLADLDPDGRALFAAMLGRHLAEGGDGTSPAEIIDGHLMRERESVWRPQAQDVGWSADQAANALALATVARQMTMNQLATRLEGLGSWIPLADLHAAGPLFTALTGEAPEDGVLPPLEPDLVGERLLLNRLLALGEIDRTHPAIFLGHALRIGGYEAAFVLRQVAQDWPARFCELVLPAVLRVPQATVPFAIAALRACATDAAGELRALVDGGGAESVKEARAELLRAVLKGLRQIIDELESPDEDSQKNAAIAVLSLNGLLFRDGQPVDSYLPNDPMRGRSLTRTFGQKAEPPR